VAAAPRLTSSARSDRLKMTAASEGEGITTDWLRTHRKQSILPAPFHVDCLPPRNSCVGAALVHNLSREFQAASFFGQAGPNRQRPLD